MRVSQAQNYPKDIIISSIELVFLYPNREADGINLNLLFMSLFRFVFGIYKDHFIS